MTEDVLVSDLGWTRNETRGRWECRLHELSVLVFDGEICRYEVWQQSRILTSHTQAGVTVEELKANVVHWVDGYRTCQRQDRSRR